MRLRHRFELRAVPPYSFELTVRKPAGWSWGTPDEVYEDGSFWTAIRFRGALMGVKLTKRGTLNRPGIGCAVYGDSPLSQGEEEGIERLLARSLRVDEDLRSFYEMSAKDSILAPVVEDLKGMRTLTWPDIFPALILAVTLQMAPLARSTQMMELLRANFGENAVFDGKRIRYWPSPARVAAATVEELMRVAKLGYRAKNLRSIAESLEEGFPGAEELSALTPEEAREKLMELRGIGPYAASIVVGERGFSLDVWSAKIFGVLLAGEVPDDPRGAIPGLTRLAVERWGPWTGHAFVYVLNDLENISKRIGVDLTRY
jgi:3-methyladenine DNA glycosylase/8-oxoguanine DNA glycosylase